MKKIGIFVILFVILTILFLVWSKSLKTNVNNGYKHNSNEAVMSQVNDLNGKQKTELTLNETENLKKLIPQVLAWAYKWKLNLGCYVNSIENIKINDTRDNDTSWIKNYKNIKNKDVEVKIEVSEYQIIAYVELVGVKLKFNRINGSRLESLRPERICSLSSEKLSDNYVIHNIFFSESLSDSLNNNVIKKNLYGRIVELVKGNACYSLSNESGGKIRITVPDFEVGDPEIYILLQGNKTNFSDGVSIDWIRFGLSSEDNQYQPILEKNFGLLDETASRKKIIKENQIRTFEVSCSEP